MFSVGHNKGSVDRAKVMRWILNRNGLLLIVARFDIFHCLLWCPFSRPLLTQSCTICLPIACATSSQKFKFFLLTRERFLRAICRDFEREYSASIMLVNPIDYLSLQRHAPARIDIWEKYAILISH